MGYFIETRIDGLPWTKEGCNVHRDGHFVPYGTRDEAEAALKRLKAQDDPMWAAAEYRFKLGGIKRKGTQQKAEVKSPSIQEEFLQQVESEKDS